MQIKKQIKQFWNWYVKFCEETCEYGALWDDARDKSLKTKNKGKEND